MASPRVSSSEDFSTQIKRSFCSTLFRFTFAMQNG